MKKQKPKIKNKDQCSYGECLNPVLPKQHLCKEHRYTTLARKKCSQCLGRGLVDDRACECVYRRMFRECLNYYHTCRSRQASFSSDTVEEIKHVLCSRPHEDYIIDFENVCERAIGNRAEWQAAFRCLIEDPFIELHHRVSECTGVPLGEVPDFMAILIAFLGEALYDVKPYPLYPTKSYMGVPIKRSLFRSMPKQEPGPYRDIKDRDGFFDALLKAHSHSKRSIRRTYGQSYEGRLHRSFINVPRQTYEATTMPPVQRTNAKASRAARKKVR